MKLVGGWVAVCVLGSGCLSVCAQDTLTTVQVEPPEVQVVKPAGPLQISSPVMARTLQKKVQPEFSGDAEDASGTVVVTIVIGEDGAVKSAVPLSGPQILQPAILEAVKQWTYLPYRVEGKAVEVQTTVTIRYGVEEETAKVAAVPVMNPVYGRTRLPGGVMAGRIRKKVAPEYPYEAKQARVTGTVLLRAIITKEGKVERLGVISGPEMLRKSALKAVAQWTYAPTLLYGLPTEVDTVITVNYNFGY